MLRSGLSQKCRGGNKPNLHPLSFISNQKALLFVKQWGVKRHEGAPPCAGMAICFTWDILAFKAAAACVIQ